MPLDILQVKYVGLKFHYHQLHTIIYILVCTYLLHLLAISIKNQSVISIQILILPIEIVKRRRIYLALHVY